MGHWSPWAQGTNASKGGEPMCPQLTLLSPQVGIGALSAGQLFDLVGLT